MPVPFLASLSLSFSPSLPPSPFPVHDFVNIARAASSDTPELLTYEKLRKRELIK